MLSRIAYLIITGIFIFQSGYCQIHQPDRYEIDVDNTSEDFTIVPADSDGLLLVRELSDQTVKNKIAWEHTVLDSALNKRRIDLIYVNDGYRLTGYDYNDHKVYLFYEMPGNNTSDYELEEYDFFTGQFTFTRIKRILDIELTEFEVVDRNVVFGGYINEHPTVMLYSLDSARTKVLPGLFQDKSRLLQLVVKDKEKIIRVVTSLQLPGERNLSINIRTFDLEGKMIDNYTLSPEDRKNLITGRIVSVNTGLDIIAGTYATNRTDISRGIFLARIDNKGDKKIYYYDYADLQNFFSYMKAKREAKVRDRIKRKKVKGKKARFNYRLLVHNLVAYKGEYILVGEAYYPVYNNDLEDFWTSPVYRSYSYYGPYINEFEGYAYTHAVIIGFDKTGKLLWDNSFEIKDVTTYDLKPLVQISIKDDRIILLYNYANVIRSKIIQGNEVLEGKSFNNINLKFEDDEVQDNDSKVGGLEHWYDDSFYAYGIQRIRNDKQPGVKPNRKVFFVNKIIYY